MLKTATSPDKTVAIPFKGKIVADSRIIYQSATRAMQGNIIMALIELITNSDDSYDRLQEKVRKIFVTYQKKGFKGIFSVKDDAAGMGIAELSKYLTYYKENELEYSDAQRGYFGKGAKDALACMEEGEVVSFKDGRFFRCSVFFDENREPRYEILKNCRTTHALRKKYGIKKNGTVSSFVADPQSDTKIKVPRFATLHSDLQNHYLLRKILQNKNTTVMLINKGKKDRRRLTYSEPKGESILSDSFVLNHDTFDPFDITMEVSRAKTALSQKEAGHQRHGGLLITDDKGVVLDISLFKYDYEDMASRFFGEIVFKDFRKLMKDGELVLSPERDGLLKNHPFVVFFIKEVESRLRELVQDEKSRLQRFDVSDAGKEYQKRQKRFCDVLNEIAAEVLDFEDEVEVDPDIIPIDGFAFDMASKSVSQDKNAVFILRMDTSVVPTGTVVKLRSTNPTIKFQNKDNQVIVPKRKKGSRIVTKTVTVVGSKPDESGTIIAKTKDHTTKGRIYISAPEDISKYGMAFQFENCNAIPNKPKKVLLLASTKAVQDGDIIILESDSGFLHMSHKKIAVTDMIKSSKGILKFELEIWGEADGQEGMITATCDSYSGWTSEAMIEVKVRYKNPAPSKSKRITFSPAELRSDLDPPQAASYSREMKKVFIYTKFPTVASFVGSNMEFMNSLPGQMCIAQLTIEKYCYHLASEEIEGKGTILSESNKHDAIQGKANQLMNQYAEKLMAASIDQTLLRKALREKKGKK